MSDKDKDTITELILILFQLILILFLIITVGWIAVNWVTLQELTALLLQTKSACP